MIHKVMWDFLPEPPFLLTFPEICCIIDIIQIRVTEIIRKYWESIETELNYADK